MNNSMRVVFWLFVALIAFVVIDNIINMTMMKGVNRYYGLDQNPEILLIGHSHLMLATDKEKLEAETGMKVSKYCREGVNVTDKKAMVTHFLSTDHADSIKYVFYGVDLATFTGDGLSQNSYKLFYPFIDEPSVSVYIKEHASISDYWLHRLIKSTRFNDDGLKNSAARGWLDNWSNLKTNTIDVEAYRLRLSNGDERRIQMNPKLIKQFDETISMLTERGVKVILVNTPTLDLLNQFEPEKYSTIMNWFDEYASKRALVEFWDFNPTYESDYSIFSDRLHLNKKGQQLITEELINKIQTI